jgi:chromosome segregation ATPase
MEIQSEKEQLAASLSQAIQHYENLLKHLQEMDQEMGTASPDTLQNFSVSLQEFQEQAMLLDRNVAAQLNKELSANESIQSLIGKREALLKEILALNTRMNAKAQGVKSLIAHEIGRLHTGLSALSGYRQPQHNQGRITNCTS